VGICRALTADAGSSSVGAIAARAPLRLADTLDRRMAAGAGRDQDGAGWCDGGRLPVAVVASTADPDSVAPALRRCFSHEVEAEAPGGCSCRQMSRPTCTRATDGQTDRQTGGPAGFRRVDEHPRAH
jgi:hypothetical protein